MSTYMDKYIKEANNIRADLLEKFYYAFLHETGLCPSEVMLVQEMTKDKLGYKFYFVKRDEEE